MTKIYQGFTLIELLIGITMAAIIFVTTSALLITVMTQNTKAKKSEVIAQTKNDLAIDFVNYIRWADKVEFNQDERKLTAYFETGDNIIYQLNDNRIDRNGDQLTSNWVVVESFAVEDYDDGSYGLIIDLVHKEKQDLKDRLKLIISPRNRGEDVNE